MKSPSFDRIFRDVPQQQKEQLLQFRTSHPPKHLTIRGVEWEYIACWSCEKDPASTEADWKAHVALYPNSRLHVIAGAGHTAGMQKLDEYLSVVHEFLSGP
jgi:hypothetical protein